MRKRFYLSIACTGAICSLFAGNANEEIARGEERGGGGHRDDHQNYNHNDDHRNDEHRNDYNRNDQARRDYNRYDNHNFYGGDNRYNHNQWNNNRGAYNEGIIDGVLLNNTYNPDVEYTPPGSTDNFNQVYQENLQ